MLTHRIQMVGRRRRHVEYMIPRRRTAKWRRGGEQRRRRRRRKSGEAVHWRLIRKSQ